MKKIILDCDSGMDDFTHGTARQAENFLPDPVTPLCKKHADHEKFLKMLMELVLA